MSDFKLSDFTKRGSELLVKTRRTFDEYRDLEISNNVSLPKTMQAEDGPIKLVFVGQYSSGKSSLIKCFPALIRKLEQESKHKKHMLTSGVTLKLSTRPVFIPSSDLTTMRKAIIKSIMLHC